ncbi:MAG: helix-turn-helix domain-containing GNAT family N-acetyltransferase [Azospirillaceae bacterium]
MPSDTMPGDTMPGDPPQIDPGQKVSGQQVSGQQVSGQIAAVRAFNRFYTRQIGLLNRGLHRTSYPLTQARVLWELAHRDGLAAGGLAAELGIDPAHLSRILKRFVDNGLVARAPAAEDARKNVLALTGRGRAEYAMLRQAAIAEADALLAPLRPADRDRLVGAMDTVRSILSAAPEERREAYLLRPLRVGDLGWIAHRQGVLYAEEHGWDQTFEALVAEILAGFVKNFDAAGERAWIAERDGRIVGSVFVVRASDEVAKLRLLYVEPAARGLGIGGRLVAECIRFARAKGYRTLTLWTNDVLTAARRLYEAAGFRLVDQAPHHAFGKDLVGQNWALDL